MLDHHHVNLVFVPCFYFLCRVRVSVCARARAEEGSFYGLSGVFAHLLELALSKQMREREGQRQRESARKRIVNDPLALCFSLLPYLVFSAFQMTIQSFRKRTALTTKRVSLFWHESNNLIDEPPRKRNAGQPSRLLFFFFFFCSLCISPLKPWHGASHFFLARIETLRGNNGIELVFRIRPSSIHNARQRDTYPSC